MENKYEENLSKYLGVEMKPYIKPKALIIPQTEKPKEETLKKDVENILLEYLGFILKKRRSLTNMSKIETFVRKNLERVKEAHRDYKKHDISFDIIYKPMNIHGELGCNNCSKHEDCWIIDCLVKIANAKNEVDKLPKNKSIFSKEKIGKKKVKTFLIHYWKLSRIKQDKCITKKNAYLNYIKRRNENEFV